ncbi:DedA family protein [Blastococcus sp. LR1]|uniref:DedA family protein n=1 Tax=Blastococcus sp. LR1 TaxID=2877000 RepID=UPI001CCCF7CB|nr:DedA family protein [Blastococcus sp. LR1]MCA0143845.1 DedA family protein [Blastococcus sp. LR1]
MAPSPGERDYSPAGAGLCGQRRRQTTAVLFGRFVPVVRSLVSIPAGVERMPLVKFILYTSVGSALWNALFVLLGYGLGARWQQVGAYSSYINNTTIALIVVAITIGVIRRVRTRRASGRTAR